MQAHLHKKQAGWLIQLAQFGKLLLRWGWYVVFSIILITVFSRFIPDSPSVIRYQATLRVQVNLGSGVSGVTSTNMATLFYAALLVNPTTLNFALPQINKQQQFKDLQLSGLKSLVTATPVTDTIEVLLTASSDTPHDATILVTDIYQAFINKVQDENAQVAAELKGILNTELVQDETIVANTTTELQNLSATGQRGSFQYRLLSQLHADQQNQINRIDGLLLTLELQGIGSPSILALGSATPLITPVPAAQSTQSQRLLLSPLIGLIMGVSGAMLASRFSNKLPLRGKKRERVLPHIAAIIPELPNSRNNRLRLQVLKETSSECLPLLRHLSYQASEHEKRLRFITITSPQGQEGKSTIATNLAIAAAQSGLRTLLVDANIQPRRAVLHRWFQLPNTTGTLDAIRLLATGIAGPSPILSTSVTDLGLIPIGNPNQSKSSSTMLEETMLEETLRLDGLQPFTELLSSQADLIIFDGPSFASDNNIANLTSLSDIVLLIVDPQKSKNPKVLEAEELLSKMGVSYVTVLNRTEREVVE